MKLDSLLQQVGKTQGSHIPPVEKWQPALSGDIDIEIKADGSWWHEGTVFERLELVNLFASILRHEAGEYFLVTPVEKWRIRVEDRPLQITLIEQLDGALKVITNTADSFVIDAEHPLKMSAVKGVLLPEVRVRHDLWARFSRNAWYELLQFAAESADGQVSVTSQGHMFKLS